MKKFKFGIMLLVILTIIVVLVACQPSNPTPQPAGKVTVVFDLNGGEMSEQSSVQVDKGSYLQLPVPTRTGYTFLGWFVGEGVNAGQVTNSTAITQDITITAHWQVNTYTVSFETGTDEEIEPMEVTFDQQYTLPTFERIGYSLNWYSGKERVDIDGVWSIADDVTLVAHWQANTYTVTFETGIGQEIEPMEVTFGHQYTLPSLEREHYTFMGWYNNYSEVGLTGNWSIASDVTLVASWQEMKYAVAYNNVEDCYNANPANITISQLPYTLKDAGKNDHVFEGWYVDPDFTTRVTQIDQLGMTLYAKFTAATSGLEFSSDYNGVKVTGYNGAESDIIIPSYHNGFVTSIGYRAFYDCSSLISIVIPSSVTSIEEDAFSWCSSLESIVIPSSVTSIEEDAFRYCSSLTSIVIPSSVTSIGNYAFDGCSSLASIVLPSSVTSIGEYAFYNCSSIASIVLPSSVTSIGEYAFCNCSSLASIVLPSSVSSIGYGTFEGCSSLTIYCEEESQPMGWSTDWNSSNCPVVWGVLGVGSTAEYDYVLVEEGIHLSKWMGTGTVVTMPSEVGGHPVLGFGTIFANSNVTAVEIPSSVTSIANYTFYGCSSLTSIVIPSSVTSIGSGAFSGCSSLESIVIPSSVTSIGSSAFWCCSSLASIKIPSSVTSIGDYAFYYCSNLTIYCEAESQPSSWAIDWNFYDCPVVWGYKG